MKKKRGLCVRAIHYVKGKPLTQSSVIGNGTTRSASIVSRCCATFSASDASNIFGPTHLALLPYLLCYARPLHLHTPLTLVIFIKNFIQTRFDSSLIYFLARSHNHIRSHVRTMPVLTARLVGFSVAEHRFQSSKHILLISYAPLGMVSLEHTQLSSNIPPLNAPTIVPPHHLQAPFSSASTPYHHVLCPTTHHRLHSLLSVSSTPLPPPSTSPHPLP